MSASDVTPPSIGDLLRVFGRIGLLSFGGPAAQIAVMHKELVEARPWLSEDEFLGALSFCMLLPGPEAMQLATYSGWKMRGVMGGLMGGLLFVLPGAIVMMMLAWIYAAYGGVPLIDALFLGIKAAVVVVVIEALLKVSKKALHGLDRWIIAGLAFIAIFFLSLPFPLIILAAGLYGFLTASSAQTAGQGARVDWSASLSTIAIWSGIWLLPLGAAALAGHELLLDVGLFFSKLAIVTFGGAYALLAYVAQDVVQIYGWLEAGEMLDGLGLAETTPGPLILVTQFVGFLAGWSEGGAGLAVLAALMTLWVTFIPCFLWIFLGAPYVAWISEQPRLKSALSAITAAVVGVILNLSLWFALHVAFRTVSRAELGPFTLWTPTLSSIDLRVLALTAIAALLLFVLRRGLMEVLLISALGGLLLGRGWLL